MGEFLENLKKSVESGDFNSEAAKKIIEIDKLATEKKGSTPALNAIFDKMDSTPRKPEPSEEEVLELNSAYEKKMEEIKKQDAVNAQLATLIEIEDMVKLSVIDMLSFTKELEEKFGKEFEAKDPMFSELYLRVQEVKNVFEPTLVEYKHKE
jgi:hypothetical protein